jgi:hypothetical protein
VRSGGRPPRASLIHAIASPDGPTPALACSRAMSQHVYGLRGYVQNTVSIHNPASDSYANNPHLICHKRETVLRWITEVSVTRAGGLHRHQVPCFGIISGWGGSFGIATCCLVWTLVAERRIMSCQAVGGSLLERALLAGIPGHVRSESSRQSQSLAGSKDHGSKHTPYRG